jgi:hypothetical protein
LEVSTTPRSGRDLEVSTAPGLGPEATWRSRWRLVLRAPGFQSRQSSLPGQSRLVQKAEGLQSRRMPRRSCSRIPFYTLCSSITSNTSRSSRSSIALNTLWSGRSFNLFNLACIACRQCL